MPDRKGDLRRLDGLEPDDLWDRIEARTQGVVSPSSVDPAPTLPRKALIASVAFAVFIGSALLVVRAFRSPEQNAPGGRPDPTYTLSDLKISYPYDDPGAGAPREDAARVSFVSEWPDSGFPGTARCEMRLWGSSGDQVGMLRFSNLAGTDGARSQVVTPVSGEPTSVEASCADVAWGDSTGAGYVLSGPTRIEPAIDLWGQTSDLIAEVTFDVAWEEPSKNPGLRTCYVVVVRSDGSEDPPLKYNLLSGAHPIAVDVEGPAESIADARMSCGPLEE